MKNITVSVDTAIYQRARIKAAEMNTSVSALVKAFLVQLTNEESDGCLLYTSNLSGAGGYSLAVPFSVQVRSAIETLGNTCLLYTSRCV